MKLIGDFFPDVDPHLLGDVLRFVPETGGGAEYVGAAPLAKFCEGGRRMDIAALDDLGQLFVGEYARR